VVDLFVKSHTKIEQPRWLKIDEMPGPIVRFDPSNKPSTHRIVPIGANMAFRRVVFERYGNFRTDMGPNGAAVGGAEDTEFGRRLLRGGERLVYSPGTIVYRPVDPQRLTKRYFQRWYFCYGKALMKEHGYPLGTITYRAFRGIFSASSRLISSTWFSP
jgi:hypothetical protein